MTISVNTPKGTSGAVVFPDDYAVRVSKDGKQVDKAELISVPGGEHLFVGHSV